MGILRTLIRKIRDPLIRFLAQGDLIIVGDVLARPNQPSLVTVQGGRRCVIYGAISLHEDNPGCIVPSKCKFHKPCVAAESNNPFIPVVRVDKHSSAELK